MKLSIPELLKKYPKLAQFQDQKWLQEASLKSNVNHKEIPLMAALCLIDDVLYMLDNTKFNSNWEKQFSIQIRMKQIKDLLLYFCEDTKEDQTLKGTNLHDVPIQH